jgi:hypothetical protein
LDTINLERNTGQILAPFVENLSGKKESGVFQEVGATTHTVVNSMILLCNVFGD